MEGPGSDPVRGACVCLCVEEEEEEEGGPIPGEKRAKKKKKKTGARVQKLKEIKRDKN